MHPLWSFGHARASTRLAPPTGRAGVRALFSRAASVAPALPCILSHGLVAISGLASTLAAGCSGHSQSEFAGTSPSSGASQGLGNPLGGGAADGSAALPVVCAAGAGSQCVATCGGSATTTYSGVVYDPAGNDPLYNVAVYVPGSALPDLPAGAGCDCASLFPQTILTSATTDADGAFVLSNVPTGSNVPLVVQTGKWRRVYSVAIDSPCESNAAPDHSLRLPSMSAEGNLPDIAISTGGADSLECLPLRIGVDSSEFTAGAGGPGHVHIFTGYAGATTVGGSPQSYQALWDSTTDLMKNDVVLLSCEGQETANVTAANQQALLDYASLGGRVFASHYHYVWFDQGPFDQYGLARWETGPQIVVPGDTSSVPADVDTLLASGQDFPEGAALQQWLQDVGALEDGELPIWYARDNVTVLAQPPSVEWIHLDPSVSTAPSAPQYFSVDTPVGGSEQCGRVVYSDLHVSGGPDAAEPGVPPDYPDAGVIGSDRQGGIVPAGCALHPLTPQEKALEFMLFDLSSCLIPIGQGAAPPR